MRHKHLAREISRAVKTPPRVLEDALVYQGKGSVIKVVPHPDSCEGSLVVSLVFPENPQLNLEIAWGTLKKGRVYGYIGNTKVAGWPVAKFLKAAGFRSDR